MNLLNLFSWSSVRVIARAFLPGCVILAALCALPLPAFGAGQDSAVRDYFDQKASLDEDVGERHLEIGGWCEKKGLLEQARERYSIAISRGSGKAHEKAIAALGALERLAPDQIRKKFHAPSGKELKLYRLKVARAELEDRRDRKKLADFAWTAGKSLEDVAMSGYASLIETTRDIAEVDDEGRIVLDVGIVPAPVSKTVLESGGAITINNRLAVRNALLRRIPSVNALYMARSDGLALFSEGSLDEAVRLHEVGEALLPYLKKDLGRAPDRTLNVCVLHAADSYAEYCTRSGHGEYTASNGFTNLEDFVSVVRVPDVDGRDLTPFQVQSIMLHELVHLFQFAITATPMPSWYAEGLAETYGGAGTYEWDRRAKRLRIKGLVERRRIASLQVPGNLIGLEEFLALDASALHSGDRAMTERFYTQSWAFLRFLRTGAGRSTARKLADWEDLCRHNRLDCADARSRFRIALGKNLKGVEKAFAEFVKKL